MATPPTGTVTFLYTDVEGSTRLWEQDSAAMRSAVDRHLNLLRTAVHANGGHVFRTVGDGLCSAFAAAPQALTAAFTAQQALVQQHWETERPLRVRMALHTGNVQLQEGDYVGACLNRLSRLLTAGHGGQILLSQATAALVRDTLPEGVGLRDLGKHWLRDLRHAEPIYQLVHPAFHGDFPPLRSVSQVRHNLPAPLTSFIGRQRDLAEVKQTLERTRLLTLTGTGGCGKTRLALHVAGDVLERYPDGVWFVDLASLTDPASVPMAVAGVLAVREQPGEPQAQTLIDVMRTKRLLLLLDNCEHLLEACALLAEGLLRACPDLRILATSREVLRLAGEVSWRVPSLELPVPTDLRSMERLSHCEAVRLFVERAQAVLPSFAIMERNAALIAQVCRRLDGIPLALELAAARVRVLTVEQMTERLDDCFRLLTSGSRTALPRQQTLRAAVDWSYQLLDEQERLLFARLSVFVGGWTLEAVEEVCAFTDIAPEDILEPLARLVDKSLVLFEQGEDGVMRYRLLETLRQYGRERLLMSAEARAMHQRHAACFLSLAEQAAPFLESGQRWNWLARLEKEHGNLRAALTWCASDEGDVGWGLRLAAALPWFWYFRSHVREGREWLATMLARNEPAAGTAIHARALLGAGALAWGQDDFPSARAQLAEALASARRLGDARTAAGALTYLGLTTLLQGDLAGARACYEEGLARARAAGDESTEASLLRYLGFAMVQAGDRAAAGVHFRASLAHFRRLGDAWGGAFALESLGGLAVAEEDHTAARSYYEDSIALLRRIGDRWLLAMVLANYGAALAKAGDAAGAQVAYAEALQLWRSSGHRSGIIMCLAGLAGVAAAQRHAARSGRLFGAATKLLAKSHALLDGSDSATVEQAANAARSRLDPATFGAAWTQGQELTLDQAIACALDETEGDGSEAVGPSDRNQSARRSARPE